MAKVWNITDHPKTSVTSRVMMVLGRSVRPGKCINVPDDRLVGAHKVHRAVEARKLFVGARPPHDYLMAKHPPRVELHKSVTRSHGPLAISRVTADMVEPVLGDSVGDKEEVTAELNPSSESSDPTTSTSEDSGRGSGRRKKRSRS